MITTHYYAVRRTTRSGDGHPKRRRDPATPATACTSTQPAPAESADRTPVAFGFRGGRPLSPTEVATLRVFAAAGIRPLCVLDGSDRAPDLVAHRAALHSL